MTQEFIVVKSIEILTTPDRVWSALTESDTIAQWMGDTHIETKWEMGSDIIFTGTMPNFNKKYRDRGTVLAVKPLLQPVDFLHLHGGFNHRVHGSFSFTT